MKLKQVFLILAFSLMLVGGQDLWSASKIYMPYFELINIKDNLQYPSAKLFKDYVDEIGQYELVLPPKPDSIIAQPSPDQIRSDARTLGCPYYLVGTLNRLSDNIIVTISIYKTDDGSTFWHDRLKAGDAEDLDPIMQKLARTIGTKSKATEDENIYNVTNYESQQLRQVRSNNSWGVSIGGAGIFSGPFADDPFSAGGGAFWAYDARTMIYEVDAQLYFMGKPSMGLLSINAYVPLLPENVTPFLGGGLGVGYSITDVATHTSDPYGYYTYPQESTGAGLMLFLGGGYMFGRASSVGLRLRANYFIGLYKMKDPSGPFPHGLILNAELSIGK